MTTHKVTCNVAKDKCADNWYAPGYISSRSGCCHCKASCVITGYQPGSDVIQHSLIDLDQKEMVVPRCASISFWSRSMRLCCI